MWRTIEHAFGQLWGAVDAPGLPDVSNLTATAVLGWYAWHTASRTIPALLETFRQEMAASRADCRVELAALHDELNRQREQDHDDHQAILDALRRLAERGE